MHKEEALKTALFQAIIRCVRANHADAKDARLSLYEVVSVSKDKKITLKDLL